MFLRFIDLLSSVLICLAVVFSPWAFGTTQPWSINVMNVLGCTLGLLWLVKVLLLRPKSDQSTVWNSSPDLPARVLMVATVLVVLYCLTSAMNARATYAPDDWAFQYHPVVWWLPHSYDADHTWLVFWQSLGLAGFFWALRDWLLTKTPPETWEISAPEQLSPAGAQRLSARIRLLLWVLAVSGALLAVQGVLQRLGGGDKLLWLLKPEINGANIIQFGAWPYRAHAAQYFNLLWPVILGFCWSEFNYLNSPAVRGSVASPKPMFGLAAAVIVMAICPLVTTSRAGAGIMLLNLILAAAVLWYDRQKQELRGKLIIPVIAGIILTVGGLLGWAALAPRLTTLSVDAQSRAEISQVGGEISADNPLFGTGPGSLETMYQLYRHDVNDFWPDHLHNDWQETLATFGWLGFALLLACLVLAVFHYRSGSGIPVERYFVKLLWIALAGCLLHARFDWPFECYSVLTLFLVVCAILSCLARKTTPG